MLSCPHDSFKPLNAYHEPQTIPTSDLLKKQQTSQLGRSTPRPITMSIGNRKVKAVEVITRYMAFLRNNAWYQIIKHTTQHSRHTTPR